MQIACYSVSCSALYANCLLFRIIYCFICKLLVIPYRLLLYMQISKCEYGIKQRGSLPRWRRPWAGLAALKTELLTRVVHVAEHMTTLRLSWDWNSQEFEILYTFFWKVFQLFQETFLKFAESSVLQRNLRNQSYPGAKHEKLDSANLRKMFGNVETILRKYMKIVKDNV